MASVLVVDDSAVVRRMLGVILERDGHDVRFAIDGEEALAALRSRPPDLVLTDVEMPRMDGGARAGAEAAGHRRALRSR